MIERAFGLYIGEVVDDYDADENRYRVKVRVHGINAPSAPPEGLDWAEVTFPGASPVIGGAGDFKPYRNGDSVYVMYVAGNTRMPVVVGPMVNTRGGVPSTPVGQSVEHESAKKRWTRRDRAGNEIELSEDISELHVKLRSGGASITLSQLNDSIIIKSTQGHIKVEGSAVDVVATTANVSGRTVNINADGKDMTEMPAGQVGVQANKRIDITASGSTGVGDLVSKTEVNIGGKADIYKGIAVPPPLGGVPKQTDAVNIRPENVNIGVGPLTDPTIDYDDGIPLEPTKTVSIRSTVKINIKTAGMIDIQSTGLVYLASTACVLTSTGTMSVMSYGQLNVNSAGPLTLSSVASLSFLSPNINFSMEGAIPPIISPPVP